MNDDGDFQIVCVDCGCLAIRIEDPVNAPREAVVYCGDCGVSRGTVGALRDLAVQPDTDVILTTGSILACNNRSTMDYPRLGSEISRRYGELRRLRRQVEIAEALARDPVRRPTAISRIAEEM